MIAKRTEIKYLYVIHVLKKKRNDQTCFSASANYFASKTETRQTTAFAKNVNRAAAHKVIRQNPGPTRFAKSQCSELSDTFTLFLRSCLQKTVGQWTNHEGAKVYGSSWKPVDDGEFKVFLGIFILSNVYKLNSESAAQLWSTLDGQPIFNCPMSGERYQQILRVFRFDKSQSRRHH